MTLNELETSAPVIGSVLPAGPRRIAYGPWPRLTDIAADGADGGWCQVAAASVVGLGHATAGACRQDAYGFGMSADGVLYVAVADGLGNRPASHLGAALFCESVMTLAVAAEGRASDPLELAAAASDRTAAACLAAYGLSAEHVLCVAIVGMITEVEARLVRIGDGNAFRIGNGFDEQFPSDDYNINVVKATVPGDVAASAEVAALPFTAPLVLATDGLAIDISTSPALRAWLGERWHRPLGPHAMADTLRYRRQGSHDDRTGVVIWPTV